MPVTTFWKTCLLVLTTLTAGSAVVEGQEPFSFRKPLRRDVSPRSSSGADSGVATRMNYFPSNSPEEAEAETSDSPGTGERRVPMREQMRPAGGKVNANRAAAVPPVATPRSVASSRDGKSADGLRDQAAGTAPTRNKGKFSSPIPVQPAVRTRIMKPEPTSPDMDADADNSVINATLRVQADAGLESGIELTGASERSSDAEGFESYLESTGANEPSPRDRKTPSVRRPTGNARPVVTESGPDKHNSEQKSSADDTGERPRPNLTLPPPRKPLSHMDSGISLARGVTARVGADEGTQSPGLTMEWVRAEAMNVGRPTAVELVIRNPGQSTVSGVDVEVLVPANCELLELTPSPIEENAALRWSLGTIKAGDVRTIRMQLVPRTPGDATMQASLHLTGTSSYAMTIVEPMLELSVDGPDVAEAGEQVGYLVQVSNPGTGTADNVVITATLPEGLEHKSGKTLNIAVGTLNPGESRQAKLSLTAVRGGEHLLEVRAEAEGDLLQESTAEVRVSEPRLQVAIAGPEAGICGRNADYRVQISNSGSMPSANVRAKYKVPEGFEFVSANRGGRFATAEQTVEWFVGTLQPDQDSEFVVTLRPGVPGSALHQAGVISEHGGVTTCELETEYEGAAELEMKMVMSKPAVETGDEGTWQIRIQNTGSSPARDVGISCELPAGVTLLDVEAPAAWIAENGVLVFRSLPEVAAGDEVLLEVRVRCERAGNHRLRLRVASTSIAEPLIGEDLAVVKAGNGVKRASER